MCNACACAAIPRLWPNVGGVNSASSSPHESIAKFVENTRGAAHMAAISDSAPAAQSEMSAAIGAALNAAVEAADEFALIIPDAITAEYLEFTASHYGAAASKDDRQPNAIVMSPACGVLGLLLARGFQNEGTMNGHLTCIEPEVQHQQLAREAFAQATLRPSSFRFLPSQPLNVVSRLTNDFYDIAVAECAVEDLSATVTATLPALRPGGVLILLDSLLDGLVADKSRTDRDIVAAREADEAIRAMPGARVARLPLGAGMTLVTKLS